MFPDLLYITEFRCPYLIIFVFDALVLNGRQYKLVLSSIFNRSLSGCCFNQISYYLYLMLDMKKRPGYHTQKINKSTKRTDRMFPWSPEWRYFYIVRNYMYFLCVLLENWLSIQLTILQKKYLKQLYRTLKWFKTVCFQTHMTILHIQFLLNLS